jgi:hypothetical protein
VRLDKETGEAKRREWREQGHDHSDLFDLNGQVAIVTGSSLGIGRAIGERLAEHGARVVFSSRTLQLCEERAAAVNTRWPTMHI